MTVIDAIRFIRDNYEDIDPSYTQAASVPELFKPEITPENILEFLMQPEEEGFEEYTNCEWVEMVEKQSDPVEAAWLIIEWLWTRKWARFDGRQSREYLASKPDYEEYECPPARKFER